MQKERDPKEWPEDQNPDALLTPVSVGMCCGHVKVFKPEIAGRGVVEHLKECPGYKGPKDGRIFTVAALTLGSVALDGKHEHRCPRPGCGAVWRHADPEKMEVLLMSIGLVPNTTESSHTCPRCDARQYWKHNIPLALSPDAHEVDFGVFDRLKADKYAWLLKQLEKGES